MPFLGEAVTVGFYFCTREKPFRLTVMMIGGGGFVGIRLSPKGLVLLEMSLEAGACLSINLGVASGSVSIMVGVYLRLEADKGQLTGYFRIRGEVDVLGLISASITLELSLTYEFDTGKMVGRASIEIEVEVFFFSFSVTVSCERRLAGSNGDPTFARDPRRDDRPATRRPGPTTAQHSRGHDHGRPNPFSSPRSRTRRPPATPFHVSLFITHRSDAGRRQRHGLRLPATSRDWTALAGAGDADADAAAAPGARSSRSPRRCCTDVLQPDLWPRVFPSRAHGAAVAGAQPHRDAVAHVRGAPHAGATHC